CPAVTCRRARGPGTRSGARSRECQGGVAPSMQKPWLAWQTWVDGVVRFRTPEPQQPLRTELFTIDQLTRHARTLAANVTVDRRHHSNRLLAQLDANEQSLRSFNRVTLTVTPSRRVTPAAEWLLDNFYLIEEQIQMARRHLPKGYSRE